LLCLKLTLAQNGMPEHNRSRVGGCGGWVQRGQPHTIGALPCGLALEKQRREWWQRQAEGVRAAVGGDRLGLKATEITLAAPAVVGAVAVQNLFPKAAARHTQPVAASSHGREVAN